MYRVAIEELGGLAIGSGRLQFELESPVEWSVRELIHQVVAREIEARGLEVAAKTLATHQREATRAFATGTFTMLVDGQPITNLDVLLPADDQHEIIFIRLHPMIGG